MPAAGAYGLRLVAAALLLLGAAGGLVFWRLERPAELERYHFNKALYTSLVDSVAFEHCKDPVFEKELGYCRQHEELKARLEQFFERAGNSVHDQRLWTPLGSFCFVVNLGSTVGYATQGAPQTPHGQAAAVVFGLIAIPLFGCVFILTANHLLQQAIALEERLLGPPAGKEAARSRTLCLAGVLLLALWPGVALLFSLLEGWEFSRSLFFCFVTFSMVGFGNDVPSTAAGRIVGVVYMYLVPAAAAGIVMRLSSLRDSEVKPLLVSRLTARPWNCLAAVAALCLLGALVFPELEREEELERYERARRMYEDLNALARFSGCDTELIRHMPFCENAESFRMSLVPFFGPDTSNSMVDREAWTPFGSAQFVLSLASTVGYGAHVPHTRSGKVATVLFGLVAVPVFLRYALEMASLIRETVEDWARRTRGGGGGAGSAAAGSGRDRFLLFLPIDASARRQRGEGDRKPPLRS